MTEIETEKFLSKPAEFNYLKSKSCGNTFVDDFDNENSFFEQTPWFLQLNADFTTEGPDQGTAF